MYRYLWSGTLVAAMAIVAMPRTFPSMAVSHVAERGAAQTSCAVTGTYRVGRRPLPIRGKGLAARAVPSPMPNAATGPTLIQPLWLLSGVLTIATYSGCAQQQTSGTFAVTRLPSGPIILERPRGRTAVPCQVPCRAPFVGVVGVSGTFVQDPTHPADAAYVSVSATITSTRLGPQMGRPCSVQYGCSPPVVITTTATMTGVTGYVQAGDGQDATLSFLTPPVGAQAPVVMQLFGYRGVAPLPAPAPRDDRRRQGT